MYRWGYYLGTGIFSDRELQVAAQALKDIGDRLGDPSVRDLCPDSTTYSLQIYFVATKKILLTISKVDLYH